MLHSKDDLAPLFYTDSVADLKDIFVFAEDMTNEDEEKQALAELERLKQEKKEMRRKQREERRRIKEEREGDCGGKEAAGGRAEEDGEGGKEGTGRTRARRRSDEEDGRGTEEVVHLVLVIRFVFTSLTTTEQFQCQSGYSYVVSAPHS